MISRKNKDLHTRERRLGPALPAREPGAQLLQPAEAARRLGQRVLPRAHGVGRRVLAGRQVTAGAIEGVEGVEGVEHHVSVATTWKKEPLTIPRRPPAWPRSRPAASVNCANGASLPGSVRLA